MSTARGYRRQSAVLRYIEDTLGLPPLGNAAKAQPLALRKR